MMTDIIIPQYMTTAMTLECLESIRKCTTDYRIILVDDGTKPGDGLRDVESKVRSMGEEHLFIHRERNLGYGPTINQGMAEVKTDRFVEINNDVVVTPNWLKELHIAMDKVEDLVMVSPVTKDMSGICGYRESGPKVGYTRDKDPEEFFASLPPMDPLIIGSSETEYEVIPGFCTLLDTEVVLHQLGGYDDQFLVIRGDSDLNDRIHEVGYKTGICFNSFVYHRMCYTRNRMDPDVVKARRLKDFELYGQKRRAREERTAQCE